MTGSSALEEIDDEDWLLRRILDQPEAMWTRKDGVLRPTSAALKPSEADGALSVDVRRLLAEPARPTSALGEGGDDGLVEFRAAEPRRRGLEVEHAPLEGRYSHANVVGFSELEKKDHLRIRRELAKLVAWVREPASAAHESS